MENLKFRIWDGTKFHNNEDFFIMGSKPYCFGEFSREDIKLINGKIEQFTGLKDINNKEIFEGDIVKALSSDNGYLSIIKWDEGDGQWGFLSIKCKNMSYSYNLNYGCSQWEIVGNIHQNKNLLC